jgi:multicomponent Na+:H+ antiporter subunit E
MRRLLSHALVVAARLGVWILLSGDVQIRNVLLGLLIAVLLPGLPRASLPLAALLGQLIALPGSLVDAYRQAFAMVMEGYGQRLRRWDMPLPPSARHPLIGFLWLLRVTLTPRTVVLEARADQLRIHQSDPPERQP